MIPVFVPPMASTNPGLTGGGSFYAVLQSLGLTANLQTCLDAGSATSYTSGQTWVDLSGNGYSFFRGVDGSAGADDPTFNGVAGRESSGEYFSVNGSQYLTLNQAAPTWTQTLHQANAKFTGAIWFYANNITSTAQLYGGLGNIPAGNDRGIALVASSSSLLHPELAIENVSATAYVRVASGAVINNAWNFVAISYDFSTGVVIFNINGVAETYTSQALSSPNAAANTEKFQIAATGANGFPDSTGCRTADVAMWNTGLTSAQLGAIFTATRSRFGI